MKRLIFCILILLGVNTLLAQREQTLGLVLSGGGAKGLAHIGVLKALEEEGIPIDYIGGTSMGAIVGGLYASGYSPEEIEEIFFSKDFENWLSGRIDERLLPYYRTPKKDATLFQVNLNIDKKFKADIPLSLINPVQMDYAFLEIFAEANKICNGDFNNLMIPFFCVATNVNDNKPKIMRNGDLGRSIRASMTFPFFFSPIQIDGKMMCDGGIYNNFPSNEMQEFFNPDIILGVKVANNFDDPNEEDLILYIENMVSNDSKYEIPCDEGVLLEPDMSDIDVMDFSQKMLCIKRGYDIAKENIERIKYQFIDTLDKNEMMNKRNSFNAKKDKISIGNIIIHGAGEHQQKYFEKMLTMNMHDDTLTINNIKPNYLTLCSHPNVRSVTPYMYYDHFTKDYILELNVRMKRTINTKVGGIISSDPISNLFLGIDYNSVGYLSWQHKLNFYAGRFYQSAMYDVRLDIPNLYYPFFVEGKVILNHWNYFRNHSSFFEYSALNYIVQRERNVQLKIGLPISRRDMLTAKIGYGYIDDKYFAEDIILSTDTADNTTFSHLVVGIMRDYCSLDNIFYPTEGFISRFNVQFVKGIEKFHPGNASLYDNYFSHKHTWIQISFNNKFYRHISKLYSLGFSTNIFYSFQDLFYTRKSSLLNAGTYTPTKECLTSFYPEYRANQYLAGGMEQIFNIGSSFIGNASLRFGTYIFAPVRQILANEFNQAYYGDLFQKLYGIASLSLIISTPIGDFSAGVSYHQRDNDSSPWNISVSFGSIMFNEKNIDR
ncbi:MAG: patatin-like phospholipase family protein [Bacteroidales bacterium]|nr:patatin-like phospholipase family protein [Bacteroidales bacterium]